MSRTTDKAIEIMNADQQDLTNYEHDVVRTAADMLGITKDDVSGELISRLCRTAAFIRTVKPGGGLHSTQVIASICEQYSRDEYRDRPRGRHPGT